MGRALMLGIAAAALVIHLLWRLESTLAGLHDAGLYLSTTLLVIEACLAVVLMIAALADVMPATLRTGDEAATGDDLPTVDIFVLIEDPAQAPKAAYSLAVAAQVDYPQDRVNLYLVGHGRAAANPQNLLALAARTRTTWLQSGVDMPAGSALNAALARTAGSLVLALNAGDAPTADVLRRTTGTFAANPRLALADIPAFAVDADPMLHDITITQRLPGDPGHFFKSCMKAAGGRPGLLGFGQVTLWRRAALSSCGSFTRTSYRPDGTARIRAAQGGWQRAAASRPMIATLAPDTVRLYMQSRLAHRLGTIEAILQAPGPLLASRMTLREFLSWMPAFLAPVTAIAWALILAIPPIAILFQIPLTAGTDTLSGALAAIASVGLMMAMSGTLHTGSRSILISAWSELLESLLSLPFIVRMIQGQGFPPRAPDTERASAFMVVLFALLLAGTTAAVVAWQLRPDLHEALAPASAATLFGACILACLLGAISEPRQRRLAPRVSQRIDAELLLGGERLSGRLADISVHGARFIAEKQADMAARAISGVITLRNQGGRSTLPVQLSRRTDHEGRTAFGLSFTGRTVGEFATVVRLAHRSGDAYADLCDQRANTAGATRLLASLGLRGVAEFIRRLMPRPSRPVSVRAGNPQRPGR